MKFYLFLDESGDHGLNKLDPGFPIFVLCGILISEDDHRMIDNKIKELKSKFWDNKKVILHSRDIRKCEKEFQILFNEEIKKNFYLGINEIVSASDYTIIASAIKKEKYLQKYGKLQDDVYEVALSFIIERAIFFIDDIATREKEITIVIEKRGKSEDKKLEEHFQRLRTRGTQFVSDARIKNYKMEIYFFEKSKNINGLQFADLIAYPIARFVLDPERANPAFEVLEKKIYSKNGKRYGLKVFP